MHIFLPLLTTLLSLLPFTTSTSCYSSLRGAAPAYKPMTSSCRAAISKIRLDARLHPEPITFRESAINSRKLPFTWFHLDCAIMLNSVHFPSNIGRLNMKLLDVANAADMVTRSCVTGGQSWNHIGGEIQSGEAVLSVAGTYPGEVVGGYIIKNGLGSEGPDSLLNSTTEFGSGDFMAPDNSTEVLSPSEEIATTLIPVATQMAATS